MRSLRPFFLVFLFVSSSRAAAVTYTVTSSANAGVGTLREKITLANGSPGFDFIEFNIPGVGPFVINVTSALPAITDPVNIRGFTQPGAAANSLGLDSGTDALLMIEIRRGPLGPFGSGLLVQASGTIIEGLSITGWRRAGIEIENSQNCIVSGNYIGIGPSGAVADPCSIGVWIRGGSGNTIGGLTASAVNAIGAGGPPTCVKGIALANTVYNVVEGNLLGIGRLGGVFAGFEEAGIYIAANAPRNQIGFGVPGGRNVISGSTLDGVFIDSDSNQVCNNFIGTNVGGTLPRSNARHNVFIHGGTGNLIGGSATTDGNLIRFAGDVGIAVTAIGANSTGNFFHRNAIFQNGSVGMVSGLGIDLAPAGVTLNDVGDPDLGPNTLQNFPVLLTVRRYVSGDLWVGGYIETTALTDISVELFGNMFCDPSGWGEGARYIDNIGIITDASGFGCFGERITGTADLGELITSTATSLGGTSEFSKCGLRVKPMALVPVVVHWTDGPTLGQTLVWVSIKNESQQDYTSAIGELSIVQWDSIGAVTSGSTSYGDVSTGATASAAPFVIDGLSKASSLICNLRIVSQVPAAGMQASAPPDTADFAILIDPANPTGVPRGATVPRLLLDQNVPNPFGTTTSIGFEVPQDGPVTVRIYDVRGALVRTLVDGRRSRGHHTETWDGLTDSGSRAVSGVYFYEVNAVNARAARRMVLLK